MPETEFKITDPEIEDYILGLRPPVHEVFSDMEKRAEQSDVKIVGSLAGRVLFQLCAMKGAASVFELGSGFGYSALWFAFALGEEGEVVCTDRLSRNSELARSYFARAGQEKKLRFLCGDALSALADFPGGVDIIFNDIDKEEYPQVPELAREKLNPGGLLITDNALWSGRVVRDDGSESAAGVSEYNRAVFSDPGFFSTILPVRDGLAVSLKITGRRILTG